MTRKIVKESTTISQLQELSKKTLASYVNKSAEDMWRAGGRQQFHKDQANKASSKNGYKDPKVKSNRDAADKEYNRAAKRQYGISLATHKLTKESTNLQELSSDTLNRYKDKAIKQADKSVKRDIGWRRALHKTNATAPGKRVKVKASDSDWHANQQEKMKKMKKEGTDLQELSKKTLGSYINKSSEDMWRAGGRQQFHKDQANKASAKGGYKDPKVKQNRDAADREYNKAAKRQYGISLATHKLTKENTNLQELSKNTLASYHAKARTQANPLQSRKTKADELTFKRRLSGKSTVGYKPKGQLSPEEEKIRQKRNTGATRAMNRISSINKSSANKTHPYTGGNQVRKLNKESAELQELSKRTLGSYVKKASRDIDRRSHDDGFDKGRNGTKPGLNKRTMKNWRRQIGVDKAIDKITKE